MNTQNVEYLKNMLWQKNMNTFLANKVERILMFEQSEELLQYAVALAVGLAEEPTTIPEYAIAVVFNRHECIRINRHNATHDGRQSITLIKPRKEKWKKRIRPFITAKLSEYWSLVS